MAPVCTTPVHNGKESDCNLFTKAETKELSKDTRDETVHLHNTGVSRPTIGEQLDEKRSTAGAII